MDLLNAEIREITRKKFEVEMVSKDHGIRFYGIPSGYEYTSLIEAIVDVSKGTTELGPKTRESLRTIGQDVRIQVFVTPTCPYCTVAVRLGHQNAVESPRVRCDMLEATEFPHLAQKYAVYGVPKTVINERVTMDGAVSEEVFLANVLKAAGQESA
jgi:glutaredoxin-like protein